MKIFICFQVVLFSLLTSCASIGTPGGGHYDELPPRLLQSTPYAGQLNYVDPHVRLLFDELILLDKPSENIIITPPQMKMPVIRSIGRRIYVELRDTLLPNTTYTLDFNSAIIDNNEKNPLENFVLAFSTGNYIDTLAISGQVLNAEDLEPMPNVTVGLHTDIHDSAFVHIPFVRTSRTNERGQFTIRNVAKGEYRIFALNDLNRDYRLSPSEALAFSDSLIYPEAVLASRQDTLWVDSLTIDTVRTLYDTHFLPDSVSLLLFNEPFSKQYLLRSERPQAYRCVLHYNVSPDTIPLPQPLDFQPAVDPWYFLQITDNRTVSHFWLTDTTLLSRDTLTVSLTYPFTDTLQRLIPRTDTLRFVYRPPSRRRSQSSLSPALTLSLSLNPSMNLYDTLAFIFSEPVTGLSSDLFHLEMFQDSLWKTVPLSLLPDTSNTLRYFFFADWKYGTPYRLTLDSAALYSIYGNPVDSVSASFTFKNKDQYGQLLLAVSLPYDTVSAFVQLLDPSGQIVRQSPITDGNVVFTDLPPAKYYPRLILDSNGNGCWDSGDFFRHRQPEQVIYYHTAIEVIKNWDISETWNLSTLPTIPFKPLEITKNKPKPKSSRSVVKGSQASPVLAP
ncbi:MAG: Ig-like domain-containing protein [Tannerellaceae bacterium]|jgi:hypothetical protein|nr:Ig-like domain-containing protein [Tannerellaceae bacterium]